MARWLVARLPGGKMTGYQPTNPEIAIMFFALFTLGFLRATLCSLYISDHFIPPNHGIVQRTDQNNKKSMPLSLQMVCGFFLRPTDYIEHIKRLCDSA